MTIFQGYRIYRDGEKVKAKGSVTGNVEKEALIEEASSVIQWTVNTLAEKGGGEVFVECGTFPLNREVELASKITLRGTGRGTVLKVTEENGSGLIGKDCNGLIVCDLTLEGDLTNSSTTVAGIVLDDCGDSEIRNVFALRFSKYGIWVRNNAFLCKVSGCSAAGNQVANIYLDQLGKKGRAGDFVPNLVHGCMCYSGGNGIELNRVIVANIVGCEVFQAGGHSFYIHEHSNSVLISGCRSFQAMKNAVLVESSHETNISSNIFCWHWGHGIELSDVTWGAVNGNECIDNGSNQDPPKKGIWLRNGTKGVQVIGNTVFNWITHEPMSVGIEEDADCHGNLIMGNLTNYTLEKGVLSQGEGSFAERNLNENRGYTPSVKGPIPLAKLWGAIGPSARIQPINKSLYPHARRVPEFTRDRIMEFLGNL